MHVDKDRLHLNFATFQLPLISTTSSDLNIYTLSLFPLHNTKVLLFKLKLMVKTEGFEVW